MKPKLIKSKVGRGGARPASGRPPKVDKADWGRINVILRIEMIRALREAARSVNVGEYLQAHLEKFPPGDNRPALIEVRGRKKYPVIQGGGDYSTLLQPRVPKVRATRNGPLDDKAFRARLAAALKG